MNEHITQLQQKLASTIRMADNRRRALYIFRIVGCGSAFACLIALAIDSVLLVSNDQSPFATNGFAAAGRFWAEIILLVLLSVLSSVGINFLCRRSARMEKAHIRNIIREMLPEAACKLECVELYPSIINVSFFFGNFDHALSFGNISFHAGNTRIEVRDIIVKGITAPCFVQRTYISRILSAARNFIAGIFTTKTENMASSFRGMFVNARMRKSIQGSVIVLPDHLERRTDYLSKTLQSMRTIRDNHNLKFDNPEFEDYFSVYSTNEATARSILTPSLTRHIIDLKKQYGRDVMMSFVGDLFFFGVSMPEGFLSFASRAASVEKSIPDLYDNISAVKTILAEINLE
jgi:hypothetical protein